MWKRISLLRYRYLNLVEVINQKMHQLDCYTWGRRQHHGGFQCQAIKGSGSRDSESGIRTIDLVLKPALATPSVALALKLTSC